MMKNLPSLCLFRILEFHSNDLLTLYRCSLVNRDWCQLTIPLLWKRPFSLLHCAPDTSSKRLMDVYVSGFSSTERKSINLRGKAKEIPTKSLFNYVTYLRELDVTQANSCVLSWLLTTFKENSNASHSIVTIFLQHFVKNSPKITHLIFNNTLYSILGPICECGNNNNVCECVNINWKLLTYTNANNCFEQLKVLECNGDFNPKLLFICSMISKQIEEIHISINSDSVFDYSKEIGKLQNLCTLIQVQRKLFSLIIKNVRNGGLGEHGVLDILELTKEIHQTLETLSFKFVDFDNYNFIKSIKNLRKLGTLKLFHCNLSNHPLEFDGFIRSRISGDGEIGYVEGSDLRGISNLKIFNSKIPISLLTFMISQANDRLTMLDVRVEKIKVHEIINLLEIISQNCKNLTEFSTYIVPNYDLLPLLLPILSSNTRLENLIIDAPQLNIIFIEDVNAFLPILGKHLPSSLRVLNVLIGWEFHHESLDEFFQESCAKLEVLKLKFCSSIEDDHVKVILKHSKNHLKLLNIEGTTNISYDIWNRLQQEEHLHVEFHPSLSQDCKFV